MKRKLLKPSPLFSKPNSKKSSLLFFVLIFSCFPVSSDGKQLEVVSRNPLEIAYSFILDDPSELLSDLERASSSTLTIQLEIRRDRNTAFMRDPLIYRKTCKITASQNLIDKVYKIVNDDGEEEYFPDSSDFLGSYLSEKISIPDGKLDTSDLSVYYVRIKGILIKRVFVEPFHIFQLFDYKNRITNNWVRLNLMQERNAD